MFSQKLDNLKTKNRHRSLQRIDGIDLSSNDYLGFKDHPVLRRAAIEALQNGVSTGAGGSRLLRGNAPEHESLEEFAAAHYGFERSLYFSNGYMANYALWSTLPTRHDVILYDSLMHACAKDGFRSSTAKSVRVNHNDLNAFEDALKRFRDEAQTLWICVESVYSMDGDIAPLKELHDLAVRYDAIMVVDEAHGTGVFGDGGRGLTHSLPRDNLISVHTCGKALGGAGGIICANDDTIDYMINAAMPFIFSTAPPPFQAYMTQKAIELCSSGHGDEARHILSKLCEIAKSALGGSGTQIVPIVIGDDQKALEASFALQDKGYDIRAIRPPTVPDGTARLRLSLSANLDPRDFDNFLDLMKNYLL